jgi:hypothetical protein
MGFIKTKTCQKCGESYQGTASSKYCIVCKDFIMTENRSIYAKKWRQGAKSTQEELKPMQEVKYNA